LTWQATRRLAYLQAIEQPEKGSQQNDTGNISESNASPLVAGQQLQIIRGLPSPTQIPHPAAVPANLP
jgi:hypothetical protein